MNAQRDAELEPDFGLTEIAEAIGMSTRWVRNRCNLDGAEHIRYGNKIRMTAAQVAALRKQNTKNVVADGQSITTGKKRGAA